MLPLQQLADSTLPDGTALVLSRRGDAYYVHADRRLIQSSATARFDEALAHTCAEACQRRKKPRILLGHLGLGRTLRSMLTLLPGSAEVSVCEDMAPLLDWHRQGLVGDEANRALQDPRVSLTGLSLQRFLHIRHTPGFDVIVLGLDNEAQPLTADYLRNPESALPAASCLREFGTLIYTSPQPEKEFAQSLSKLMPMQTEGFTIFLNPDKKKGPRLNILLARPDPT